MSCPHGPIPDYTFCMKCALGHGDLIIWKRCERCNTRWHDTYVPGGSPTKYNVIQLELTAGGCRNCREENAHASRVSEVCRPVRRGIANRIPLVAAQGCGLVFAAGRAIEGYLHRKLHKIEAALGDRKCLFCGRLTANRDIIRPMSHLSRGKAPRVKAQRRQCFEGPPLTTRRVLRVPE